MPNLTADMVRDLYARAAKPGAVLVTITVPAVGDAPELEPLRVTDWPDGLSTPDGDYAYAPFKVTWPGSGEGEPSREAQLQIAASGEAVEMIRLAGGQPQALIQRVRVAAPGVAEMALKNGRVRSARVSGGVIEIPIVGHDYAGEPAVARRYTLGRTPGAF